MSRHPMPDTPEWVALAELHLETALAYRATYENEPPTTDPVLALAQAQNELEIRRLLEDLNR